MDDITEMRPAPRRTPTGVLCLMTVIVLAGSGWLLSGLQDQPPAIASSASSPPPTVTALVAR